MSVSPAMTRVRRDVGVHWTSYAPYPGQTLGLDRHGRKRIDSDTLLHYNHRRQAFRQNAGAHPVARLSSDLSVLTHSEINPPNVTTITHRESNPGYGTGTVKAAASSCAASCGSTRACSSVPSSGCSDRKSTRLN